MIGKENTKILLKQPDKYFMHIFQTNMWFSQFCFFEHRGNRAGRSSNFLLL